MTAPELVEVVADALGTHLAVRVAAVEDGFYVECRCGAIGQIESDAADWEPANQWHAAHQARAVLAALTDAGTVEWGVAWKGAGPSGVLAFDSEEDAREAVELGGLLSRLTLPWTAEQ